MFDWIVALMGRSGYLGVGGLMFGENVFPPIPSELVMPLAGFLSAQGTFSLSLAILVGTVGSVLGALLWYCIGIWIGEERLKAFAARHGKWLTISPREVDAAADWFRRYGWRAVFFGRMVPGVRTFISVPAGVARMPMGPFLAFTALGSLIWTTALALAGYLLQSQYDRVADWINPVYSGHSGHYRDLRVPADPPGRTRLSPGGQHTHNVAIITQDTLHRALCLAGKGEAARRHGGAGRGANNRTFG